MSGTASSADAPTLDVANGLVLAELGSTLVDDARYTLVAETAPSVDARSQPTDLIVLVLYSRGEE